MRRIYIKADPTDQIIVAGKTLYLETRFDEYAHAPQSGDVIAVCEDMTDILPGDKVIFHYLATDKSQFYKGGYFIQHDMCFAVVRDGVIHMLNDWIVVEPEPEVFETRLIIPVMARRMSRAIGTLLYGEVDMSQTGQRMVYSMLDNIPLQHILHQIIDKGKVLYRMKKGDIQAFIKEDKLIPVAY